ncbi:hypothetical protein Pmani_028777 [Petrolisthes manimaculis]|uniref:heparosan-N-sulfate-glucuronate 5-epimerase n=1 Tax=Petrolisthes manimaculis TaxID=1843537 RepID=A0AAE1TV54_9EUCA|nr:hypothetical protein Pmani_028777 [Petrolisthes manimaculis]
MGGEGGGGGEEAYLEVEYVAAPPHPHQEGVGGGEEGDGGVGGGGGGGGGSLSEIPCVINHESEVSCRRDESEVYVPFSFIRSYFEVYGQVEERSDGREVFEWTHSYSRVYQPHTPYLPTNTFLNFELYNVEARDRVKCISATEGVPISTQWQSTGYTYPIQIAQFGWWWTRTSTLNFKTHESPSKGGVTLQLDEGVTQNLLVVSVKLLLKGNSSLTFGVEFKDKKPEVLKIHYIKSERLLLVKDRQIYYGLGEQTGWRHITRNVLIDIHKGAAASPSLRKKFKKVSRSKVQVSWVRVQGEGEVSSVTLSSAEHLQHFYDAADWLLRHQDHRGGWSIPVPRKVIGGVLELEAGWYSAMAQGQAMSLLVRAAHLSGRPQYLAAASRATALFHTNSTQGGVRTFFPGGMVWYEEYPTTPSLFVLNGFIYSLLGLYDLKEYTKDNNSSSSSGQDTIADRLFREGMRSLKTLLPLFDTGWGSLYDLRHFTTHVPPNRARWDYHTTHITQLLLLSSLDPDPVLSSTAERWKDYMNGKRAKHN